MTTSSDDPRRLTLQWRDDHTALTGALRAALDAGAPHNASTLSRWLPGLLTEAAELDTARRLAAHPPPVDWPPRPSPDADRDLGLAVGAAVLASLDGLDPDHAAAWADLTDQVHYSALGHPGTWRTLSADALIWSEALSSTAGPVSVPEAAREAVQAVAEAALHAPNPEAVARRQALTRRVRRTHGRQVWRHRLASAADALLAPLADALQALEEGTAPVVLAASGGPSEALARVVVGEALDGEVTLAVLPEGVLLEWDGDGTPPATARAGDDALPAAAPGASHASAAWWMTHPPEADAPPLVLTDGAGDEAVLTLPLSSRS